jgi:hypothetical protein
MVAAVTFAAAAGTARADNFHWGTDGLSISPGTYSSVFLRDDNAAAVDQFLAGQAVRVVKIDHDLSPATIASIYNRYKINYTFVDYESPDAVTRTSNLVNAIKASTGTGAALAANQAYVSNFGFAPIYTDTTAPGPSAGAAEYAASGVNMASEALYPGSPGFRNPASGNSTAPNIRSALFTLPVTRLSLATSGMTPGHAHVAYVDRFNNWGNAALDSDNDPGNGYRFVTQDQLPSRGDFQAQILHYRLRGATAVHGLQGGVEGYTPEQFKSDINQGWNGVQKVNQVLSDPKARLATLDTRVKTDGVSKTLEDAGVVLSGAYSTAQGKLVVLVSNLDEKQHTVQLPANVGGKAIAGDYVIEAGAHEILEFGASGSKWSFVSAEPIFVDDNRGGVGVPEPSTIALVTAVLATMTCARGRRRAS